MNAYYQHNNIGKVRGNIGSLPEIHAGDRIIDFICAIVAFFTSAVAVKVEKVSLCAVCFVAFFGVIGGMESGSLNLFAGLLLSAALMFVEYLTMKSLAPKKSSRN